MAESTKNTMMRNHVLIAAVVAIVVGAASFFGGMKYQQLHSRTAGQFGANAGFGAGMGRGARFGGAAGAAGGPAGTTGQNRFAGNRPVLGQIISQDDKSITVKLQDGSTRIVLLSDTTAINKADAATKTDLKVGTTVSAFGTQNPDGSLTAQNIQLNPTMMMMNGQPAASPAASTAPTTK